MRIIHDMRDWADAGSVVALGTFDGVHVGHAALIREAVTLAREFEVPAAALTFDRHPLSLIRPEAVPQALSTPEEKREKLSSMGLDALIEHPFTAEFAALSPDEFFEMLHENLHPRALVVGFNYTFGRKGAGDAGLLSYLCRDRGILCRVMEPVCVDGKPVSSSRIRILIRDGKTSEAEALLGQKEDFKNLK